MYVEENCSSILMIGCPHITYEEAIHILRNTLANLKSIGINKILIAAPMFDYKHEKYSQLKELASNYGVEIEILYGICPVVSNLKVLGVEAIATIHGKARHYIPKLSGVNTCLINVV